MEASPYRDWWHDRPGPEVYTGHVNSTEFYTNRLLVKSLAGNGGEVYINELEYYGYEEGSGS